MKRLNEYASLDTDTGRKRPVDAPVKRWLLLDGNRWIIAGLLLIGLLGAFLALGQLGIISFTQQGSTTQLLHALTIGNFTVIGLVITINQLILSWEFGSPSNLREGSPASSSSVGMSKPRWTRPSARPSRPTSFDSSSS